MVCGTCCQGTELSHESMDGHDPSGPTLCIHSVVVAESLRRKGYATTMLKVHTVDSHVCNKPKWIIPLFWAPFVEKIPGTQLEAGRETIILYYCQGTRC